MTVAAWHNDRLRLTSPALVMLPDTSLSPDWLLEAAHANPRHCHYATVNCAVPGKLAHVFFEISQFLSQRRSGPLHQFCRGFQYRIAICQFPNACLKPTAGDHTNLQAEFPQQTSHRHLQSYHILLDSLSPLGLPESRQTYNAPDGTIRNVEDEQFILYRAYPS